jgi:hypothetical protein
MKSKLPALLLALAIVHLGAPPAQAFEDYAPEAMVADTIVVRPLCLAATIVGTAVFLVSLPISLIAGKVGKSAHSLVVIPGKATFTRDLGNMSDLD